MAWIVSLSTFSAVLVVTILLLSYYTPLRRLPAYVLLTALIGWFIPFSIVILLPIDLASTKSDYLCEQDPETCTRPLFYLNNQTLLLSWRIGYWTTFALTWVVFPLMQSYADSGHRSRRRRLLSAVRENLRYHAVLLGIFALGLIYILLTVHITSFADFQALLIALANTYGLLLAIFCMGHGLVSIPSRMWAHSNLEGSVREVERGAGAAWDAKADAEDEVAAVSAEIAAWENHVEGRDDGLANWIRELALRYPDLAGQRESVGLDGRTLTEDICSKLTTRARNAQHGLAKAQMGWLYLLRRAAHLYDLKAATSTSAKRIEWKLSSPGRVSGIIPANLQYVWFLAIVPWSMKVVSLFVRVVSIGIVWSEIVHNLTDRLLSLAGIVIRATGETWFLMEVLSALILLYMAYATYSSFMRLKILNMYSLTPHHTDPVSILFYASYLCRLTVPLTYNFTTLLAHPPEGQTLSTFSTFLGSSINLTRLGSGFNDWFPLFILLPVILTSFNLYDKIRNVLGLGDLGGWIIDDEDDQDRGEIVSVVEGRGILKRELGLSGSSSVATGARRLPRQQGQGGVLGDGERRTSRYTDDDDDDEENEGENFFVATGHRLWNSISNRVDDLRGEATSRATDRDEEDGSEERGLLGRIARPRWMKRGDSGVSVWRLPRWGRGEDEGRVVL